MKKFELLILSILLIITILLNFIKVYDIEMFGNNLVILEPNQEYKDEGISVKYGNFYKKKNMSYEIESNVDTSKIGEYFVKYKIRNTNKVITRVVKIVDTIPPVIESIDQLDVFGCENEYKIDYKVSDNYDENIIVEQIKEKDSIILIAKDSSGNETQKKVFLNYDLDDIKINLNGNNIVYVEQGKKYVEKGATAVDRCGNSLSVSINSDVNTNNAGSYTVKYSAKNENDELSSVNRKVVVYKNNASNTSSTKDNVLYLTFDDGPGKYTAKILDILKEKNVKATFFVTNQFPKYKNMIAREYNEGHTIGVHSYTHTYKSIYSSVENFMNDINKMNDIIFQQTGQYSKILRFPGGSSNTVSRSYATGIMSALATKVGEEGYLYFDWNLNSGDTNGMTIKQIYEHTTSSLGKGGKIILMHDIKYNTLMALPDIIDYALAHGYQFDVLSENSMIVHSKINN